MRTISVPFTFSGGSVQSTDNPYRIARQEIINVLMTDAYERVMAPSYGASTTRLLYQTLDSLSVADYKEEAIGMLNQHLSNATVTNLTITGRPPDGGWSGPGEPEATLYVNVQYRLFGDLDSSTVSISVVDPTTITSSE